MNLFDTDGFVPRLHCGTAWTNDLVFIDILAHITIIIGYSITSIRMYQLYRYRGVDDIKNNITRLFIIFPIFCSLSRIGSILVYWWPPYRFYILLNWFCAVAAVMLALRLKVTLNTLLQFPSQSEQIRINNQLREEIAIRIQLQTQQEATNKTLVTAITRLEAMLKNELWLYDKKRAIDDLNAIINDLSVHNDG